MTVFEVAVLGLSFVGYIGASIGPVADLTISNADVSPDGFSRSAVLAGGTFPGPVITGNMGDNFQINVVNSLTDETMEKTTSIHWHGFFQKGTNWADGPAFVTQCPIASGNSFLYDFNAPDQAGTFWYHSHLKNQYCDGLRGAFVVYDPNDPNASLYDVDDETTVITLADWYHVVSPAETGKPTSDATLINGLGRYYGGPASPLAVVTVVQGKSYRFRLISISCDPNFTFSIDGHTMNVIEVDGQNVIPVTVDSIQIFAGQRYSFVLTANQNVDNYWIRANTSVGTTGFAGGLNSAILRYSGAAVADPTTLGGNALSPLLETDLHPLSNPVAPGVASVNGADVSFNLAIDFSTTTRKFTINSASFVPPTVPVLLQILSGATDPASLLPSGSIYALPPNKVIQISIPATLDTTVAGAPHPFHLHGHTFSVIRSAGSLTYNYDNPVRRDVVSTGVVGDNTTIRFVTDNPGPWFLHCHIDWHLNLGFAVVFVEDSVDIQSANSQPAWHDLCPTYDALIDSENGA